jgi:hypothetical protein
MVLLDRVRSAAAMLGGAVVLGALAAGTSAAILTRAACPGDERAGPGYPRGVPNRDPAPGSPARPHPPRRTATRVGAVSRPRPNSRSPPTLRANCVDRHGTTQAHAVDPGWAGARPSRLRADAAFVALNCWFAASTGKDVMAPFRTVATIVEGPAPAVATAPVRMVVHSALALLFGLLFAACSPRCAGDRRGCRGAVSCSPALSSSSTSSSSPALCRGSRRFSRSPTQPLALAVHLGVRNRFRGAIAACQPSMRRAGDAGIVAPRPPALPRVVSALPPGRRRACRPAAPRSDSLIRPTIAFIRPRSRCAR